MRIACLAVLPFATLAHADDDKYKKIDAARVAIIAALDAGDGKALADHIKGSIDVSDVWFDTAACRKLGKQEATAKTATALAACFKPLHVYGRGLNVYYGPEISLRVKIEVIDDKAYVVSMKGEGMNFIDASLPMVSGKAFEANKKSGDAIVLDDAMRDELEAAGDRGVVVYACVGANGKVTKTRLMPAVAGTGPTARAVTKATKTWVFEPFRVRDKPAAACGHIIVR
jgi:hypothetical protein